MPKIILPTLQETMAEAFNHPAFRNLMKLKTHFRIAGKYTLGNIEKLPHFIQPYILVEGHLCNNKLMGKNPTKPR